MTIKEILGQLAGHASVCWSPKPKGVFDSSEASGAVEDANSQIYAEIKKEIEGERKTEDSSWCVICGGDSKRFNQALTLILKKLAKLCGRS